MAMGPLCARSMPSPKGSSCSALGAAAAAGSGMEGAGPLGASGAAAEGIATPGSGLAAELAEALGTLAVAGAPLAKVSDVIYSPE